MLDKVGEDGLCPLKVVDHDDLGPFDRACLEQPSVRELSLRWRAADHGVGLDADRDQYLDERPVGDSLAVMKAAAAEDVRRVADPLQEVGDEPRFADAGRAEKREEPAGSIGDRVVVVAPEALTLALAPHERRFRVTRKRLGAGEHLNEPERLDRLGLPFEHERLDRFDANRVAHEEPRLRADQRLSCCGCLLESSSNVDRVAGDEGLSLAADHDLAGVDPHPRLETVLGDRHTHLRRGANRPQSIVLVRDRDPENGHDRVADELLDCPTVALDDRSEILEVASHARAQCLRIGRLTERRRTDEIAEEDRHDLPRLARALRRCQRCATGATEPGAVGVLAPAARARCHAWSLWRGYERAGWSSATSMSAASVAATCGSKRPAPSSSTAAEPAATARRTA